MNAKFSNSVQKFYSCKNITKPSSPLPVHKTSCNFFLYTLQTTNMNCVKTMEESKIRSAVIQVVDGLREIAKETTIARELQEVATVLSTCIDDLQKLKESCDATQMP